MRIHLPPVLMAAAALVLLASPPGVSGAGGGSVTGPSLPAAKRPAAPGCLTDSLDSASRADEKAHRFAFGGAVTRGMVGDRVGGHDARRPARTVAGRGSWIAYRLTVDPRAVTTLEVEEIHGRDQDVRGYLVLVDEKKAYLRTWRGSGAGPVHYFVQVPPTGKRQVTVKLLNQSGAPFSISRIWAFSNFVRYFDANRLAVPYHLAPTVRLTFSDLAADKTALNRIKGSLGSHPHARPAFTAFIPYAALGAREAEQRIDYVLRLAKETCLPVQLGFDTWWASTPSGSDGRGGFWTDTAYQQVVYNASRREYQLSVPNRWGNTPWLTVNHPDLLAFKTRRLEETLAYLRRRYRELLAAGKQNLVLSINLDNEPVYWASGNAGLGSDLLLADFNPSAVAAARRDGIVLDPADGLSWRERSWLARNLLGYNERIADAAVRGLGRDASIVTRTRTVPPGDLLAANVYTQAMVADAEIQYPMLSRAYPFWETAAPGSARVGGEWNSDSIQEREAVLHQIALGRNAAVNAEAGNDPAEMRGVRPGYALAQRYYTLYNYPLDRMDVAASEIRDLSQPFSAFVYQPVLTETRFTSDHWKRQAATWGNLQTGQIGNTAAIALFPASNAQPGYLTYKLQAKQKVFAGGPFLELTGRAFVFRKRAPNVFVRVMAGDSRDVARMSEVARYSDTGHFGPPERIDLSAVARGKSILYVRIEMNAPGVPSDVLSWCSVRHVRFTTPWPAALTQGLPAQDESLATVRRQNLVVSWRRDAELAIEALARQSGEHPSARLRPARAAYARGAYADAYRLACEGRSVLLPAVYQVPESGWLAPYPVGLDTAEPVTCTLQEVGRDRTRLTLRAQRPVRVTLRLRDLPPGTAYEVNETRGALTVRRARKDARSPARTTDASGALAIPVTAMAYPSPPAPRAVSGVFRSRAGGGQTAGFFIAPDDGASRLLVPTSTKTVFRRGEPGKELAAVTLEALQFGDEVKVRLAEDGTAVEVTATYQFVEGIVREFGQLTPFAMPFIVTAEGERDVIDLSAPLHTPRSGGKPVKALSLGSVDIAPGDRVRFRRNPALGRIFELWKTEQRPVTAPEKEGK